MANEEQLSILKQSVDVWNRWRNENSLAKIDLSKASLTAIDLHHADLSCADLRSADFRFSNLSRANLEEADLGNSRLEKANLSSAFLGGACLAYADLVRSDLTHANLNAANFRGANLMESNFSGAWVGDTIFAGLSLMEVSGLEHVSHRGPSRVSTDVFALSKGKIPEAFLRGCGLSDWEIASIKLYDPELSREEINKTLYQMYKLRMNQAVQISPLFISYDHADGAFVDQLETHLNRRGIRFWRDVHDAKAARLGKAVDRAMRFDPTVLLILSTNSLKGNWMEHKVLAIRELEKEMERGILCPIAVDDSWKSSPWAKRVMEQVMGYNIFDLSAWEDEGQFGSTFNKLIDGLQLFYKG